MNKKNKKTRKLTKEASAPSIEELQAELKALDEGTEDASEYGLIYQMFWRFFRNKFKIKKLTIIQSGVPPKY
jgi:hypothetical protein